MAKMTARRKDLMGRTERTVFITGCSSGIGLASAMRFAARGYRVIATARQVEALHDLESVAIRNNWSLRISACDVASEDSVASSIDFAHQGFGPVHILVNNAGYGLIGPVELVPLSEARRQLEVNTLAPIRLAQFVIPDMRAAGWGRIINVSSIAGRISIPFGGWYSASKFALESLSAALRLELEPYGIKTIAIEPGPVRTRFIENTQLAPTETDLRPEYGALYHAYQMRRASNRSFEISAETVAGVIVHAAETRRPKPRYVLTLPARAGVLAMRFLSDRMMERAIRMFYGLGRWQRAAQSEFP